MAQSQPQSDQLVGLVEASNERGVRIAGTWHNYSRYVDVPRPLQGAHVELTVKGGWIQTLEVVDGGGSTGSVNNALPGNTARSPRPNPEDSGTRERTITRLAVLKAAAAFASSRPEAQSPDVLKVAAAWERWVLRDDDEPAS